MQHAAAVSLPSCSVGPRCSFSAAQVVSVASLYTCPSSKDLFRGNRRPSHLLRLLGGLLEEQLDGCSHQLQLHLAGLLREGLQELLQQLVCKSNTSHIYMGVKHISHVWGTWRSGRPVAWQLLGRKPSAARPEHVDIYHEPVASHFMLAGHYPKNHTGGKIRLGQEPLVTLGGALLRLANCCTMLDPQHRKHHASTHRHCRCAQRIPQ